VKAPHTSSDSSAPDGQSGSRRLLVVVSAPSGAGKTSLCEWAVTAVPGLVHSVSHTTRSPRPHEVQGRDYYFVDEPTFRAMADRGEFAEWAIVHGHLYGRRGRSWRGISRQARM